jgi:hypothetical protein
MSRVTLGNGKKYRPKPDDEVRCEQHGTVTTYGKLSWIGRLALEEGLDSAGECLLLDKR